MMDRIVLVLLVLMIVLPAVVALAALVWVRAWRHALAVPESFDELATVRTADGASVVVGRYRPVGEPSPLPPVVLCHGLAMNRRAMAFDAERSLARMLSAAGRDVWAMELRGAAWGRVDAGIREVSFDTHAAYDIPAVIAHVCAATGSSQVDWVGFSMGGMLAYAHLGAMKGGGIRRLVTIGSPVRFDVIAGRMAPLARLLRMVQWRTRTPFGFLATLVAPWTWPGMPRTFHRGLSGEHYDSAAMRRVMANTLSDAPTGVTTQFARWVREDKLTSNDGMRDYLDGIAQIDVPSLVIAGSRDNLAPAASVRLAHERLGSREKKYMEVGQATGARHDYDHLDLILGQWAHEEVFPHVVEWLGR